VPRVCTICHHDQRPAIAEALVGGESYRYVSERFAISVGAIQRHKAEHIPPALSKAQDAWTAAQADDLLAQVKGLRSKAVGLLLAAE
jgi:hypothetical protein